MALNSDDRTAYRGTTILAEGISLPTDQWETGLNANTLVVGPSGSGKTRGHLIPNVLEMDSSFLVIDVKGTLHAELGPILEQHGYRVDCIDFSDPARSTAGYDPLSSVRMRGSSEPRRILSIPGTASRASIRSMRRDLRSGSRSIP